jgi:hypothetical protein
LRRPSPLQELLLRAIASAAFSTALFGAQTSQSLMDTQLTGLRAVGLSVDVDDENGPLVALEAPLITASRRILASRGLQLVDDAPSTLRVVVQQKPDQDRATHVLLSLRVELAEKVRLERLPSLRRPTGLWGTTWSTTHSEIVRRTDVPAALERWLNTEVGLFVDTVAAVNRYAGKHNEP